MEIILTKPGTEFNKINKIVLGMDNSEKKWQFHGTDGKDLRDQYH